MENYLIKQSKTKKSEFEPIKIDYYQVLIDSSFSLDRKIFEIGYENFTEFEKDMYISFKETFQSDIELITYIRAKHCENFIKSEFLNKKEECLRFINMFSYDIPISLLKIRKMADLISKHHILNFRLYSDTFLISEPKSERLNNSKKIFQLIKERDKSFRPNIKLNLDLCEVSLHLKKSNLLKSIFSFFNWVVGKKLLPGKVEQFNLFFKINEMIKVDYLQGEDLFDILEICQYAYASRINKVFIYHVSSETEKILSKLLPYLNHHIICRIVLVNPSDLKSHQNIDQDVTNQLLEDIFDRKFFIKSLIFRTESKKDFGNAENNFFLMNELYRNRNLKKNKIQDDSFTDSTFISDNTASVFPNFHSHICKFKTSKERSRSIDFVNATSKNFISDNCVMSNYEFIKKEELKNNYMCDCKCLIF